MIIITDSVDIKNKSTNDNVTFINDLIHISDLKLNKNDIYIILISNNIFYDMVVNKLIKVNANYYTFNPHIYLKNDLEINKIIFTVLSDNYKKNSAIHKLPDFIKAVNKPMLPLQTGFNDLDKLLGGGLYAGLYCIGAISSIGKTTLMLQIMDYVASMGKDVLIFSLEMGVNELIAKSISRESYLLKTPLTTREILTGKSCENAIKNYSKYANNVYIFEGFGNFGVENIRKIVDDHVKFTKVTPIVLVDYLQILAPADAKLSDKQNLDKNVLELKRISRDYNLALIAINSLNRNSYKQRVTLASFKESGSIEYGSDILLGLNFKNVEDEGYNPDMEKKKEVRSISLDVIKNRNGCCGAVELNYIPRYNIFLKAIEKVEDLESYR